MPDPSTLFDTPRRTPMISAPGGSGRVLVADAGAADGAEFAAVVVVFDPSILPVGGNFVPNHEIFRAITRPTVKLALVLQVPGKISNSLQKNLHHSTTTKTYDFSFYVTESLSLEYSTTKNKL
jgi:hypothetical protein